MNFTTLKNGVTTNVMRQGLRVQKHSPALMFGAGVVGVVATTVLAARATLRLEAVLDEHDEMIDHAETVHYNNTNYTAQDLKADKVKIHLRTGLKVTKLYGPAFVVGALSIASLTSAHMVLNRRFAGAAAAYAAVDQSFKDYRERVLADAGEEKDREYMYGTSEREVYSEKKNGEPKVSKVKTFGAGASAYGRMFGPSNANWNPTPENNLFFLKMHQKYLNQTLQSRGHVFLNEVYDALDMERSAAGAVVGWVKDNPNGDNYIDFGIWDEENSERIHAFMIGREHEILVDFNVDGVIYKLI